jgi:hypothetical protein
MKITTHHQHVQGRILPWTAALSGDVELFVPDSTIGRPDRAVPFRVISAGPGNVSRGLLNACTLEPGDIAVANLYHRSHDLMVLGSQASTFNWETVMAKIDNDRLIPLQCYLICQPDEAEAQRMMMGTSPIQLPMGDAMWSGQGDYDHKGKKISQMKIACERVVKVGPGCVVDGMWQEPQVEPGDFVIYDTSVSPLSVRVGGKAFTMVHYRHVIVSLRNTP